MQIQTGTISITNGSNIVDADPSCDWTDGQIAFQAGAPVLFSVQGDTEVPYPVSGFKDPTTSGTGNWQLTLVTNYQGDTAAFTAPSTGDYSGGALYIIHTDFTPMLGLPLFAAGDSQTAQLLSRAFNIIDNQGDAICAKKGLVQFDTPLTTTLTEITDLTILLDEFETYSLKYGLIFKCSGTGSGLSVQQSIMLPSDGLINSYAATLRIPGNTVGFTGVGLGALYASGGPNEVDSNIITFTSTPVANTAFLAEINGVINVKGQGTPLRLLLAANNNLNTLTLVATSFLQAVNLTGS